MTAVFITIYRQRTQPKIYEERSVQGQINQIIQIASIIIPIPLDFYIKRFDQSRKYSLICKPIVL